MEKELLDHLPKVSMPSKLKVKTLEKRDPKQCEQSCSSKKYDQDPPQPSEKQQYDPTKEDNFLIS